MSAVPTAVTFDCWSTLLQEKDWHEAHRRRVDALLAAARECSDSFQREEASDAFDRAWARHMELWTRGVATGAREIARWALEDLGIGPREPALDHLISHFEEASHSSRVLALQGAVETLRALEAAGVAMALICDTGLTPGRIVRRHLDRLGLLVPLRLAVFSDEVGAPKPDPRIFETALHALGVEAKDAWHVGDLRRTDVAGARAVGMTSVRLHAVHDDRDALPEADHVVDSHVSLRALLGLASAP